MFPEVSFPGLYEALGLREREKRKIEITRNRPDANEVGFAILGGGNFGVGMGNVLSKNVIGRRATNAKIDVYFNPHFDNEARHAQAQAKVHRFNQDRVSDAVKGVSMHRGLQATLSLPEAIRGKSHLLVAVPSAALSGFLDDFAVMLSEAIQKGDVRPNVALTSLIKGLPDVDIGLEGTVFPADVIEARLKQAGVRVGGSDGVQVMCCHGFGYGTNIAAGSPYSLAVGTDAQAPRQYAYELYRALVKAKSLITVEDGLRPVIEFGAVAKNFVAFLTNFVVGYAGKQHGSTYQEASMHCYANGIEEMHAYCSKVLGYDHKPLKEIEPLSRDAFMTTFGAQISPSADKPQVSRNAHFGVVLPKHLSVADALAEVETQRGSEVTVEGLSIVPGLYANLSRKGLTNEFPLITLFFHSLALRQREMLQKNPEFQKLNDDMLKELIENIDMRLYQAAISGERITTLRML